MYPAYIDWATFEKIQAMIRDNHSEYDRNKTRGVPRPGKALLHGLVHCGECGHKMVVQYKGGDPIYLQLAPATVPGPRLPVPPRPTRSTTTSCGLFFEALAPAELDVYDRVLASLPEDESRSTGPGGSRLERLRYQARLAERQYQKADPDNRLVAAELERRWEAALRELKQAEEAFERSNMNRAIVLNSTPRRGGRSTEAGRRSRSGGGPTASRASRRRRCSAA